MSTINFETVSFEIIANAGEAKGYAIGAIQEAKKGNFERANEMIQKAQEASTLASKAHMGVVSAEAGGEEFRLPALFVHAEDQLMNTETITLLAKEFIELYSKLAK